MASNLHDFGDVLVVEPQDFFITVVLVLVTECQLDGLPLLQLNLSGAALK